MTLLKRAHASLPRIGSATGSDRCTSRVYHAEGRVYHAEGRVYHAEGGVYHNYAKARVRPTESRTGSMQGIRRSKCRTRAAASACPAAGEREFSKSSSNSQLPPPLQGQQVGGGRPGLATLATEVNENSITASKRIFFMGGTPLFFSGNASTTRSRLFRLCRA